MNLKKNWLEILIVVGILVSIMAAFYMTRGLDGLESELIAIAGQNPEVQDFVGSHPGSEARIIRIAPKGVFSLKMGAELDPHFGKYANDPLVGIIQSHEFDEVFPDVWIIVYSPNPPQAEGYVVPHPQNPAAYVLFDREKNILLVEALE